MSELEKSLEENIAAMFCYIKDQGDNINGNSSQNVTGLIDIIVKFKRRRNYLVNL